jgi:hypothetical protein
MKKYKKSDLAERFKNMKKSNIISEDENEQKNYRIFKISNSNNEVVHVIGVDVSDGQTPPSFNISSEDFTGTSEQLTQKKQDLKK